MEMTKQRKILIVTAGLGLGGLVLDRLVLGPPESASADQAPAAAEQAAPPALQPEQKVQPGEKPDQPALPSFASLTERLIQTSQQAPQTENSDPFQLPAGWQTTALSDPASQQQTQNLAADTQYAKRLRDQYKFYGTTNLRIEGKDVRLAVIKRVGQSQQFLPVAHVIRVDTGVSTPDGEKIYESYQLEKMGSREVYWVSVDDPTREVVMQITVLGE